MHLFFKMNHFEKVALSRLAASAMRKVPTLAKKKSPMNLGNPNDRLASPKKVLQAGKVGDLHNPNRMAAGQVGNLFPGQTPVSNPKFTSNEIARLYAAIMKGKL